MLGIQSHDASPHSNGHCVADPILLSICAQLLFKTPVFPPPLSYVQQTLRRLADERAAADRRAAATAATAAAAGPSGTSPSPAGTPRTPSGADGIASGSGAPAGGSSGSAPAAGASSHIEIVKNVCLSEVSFACIVFDSNILLMSVVRVGARLGMHVTCHIRIMRHSPPRPSSSPRPSSTRDHRFVSAGPGAGGSAGSSRPRRSCAGKTRFAHLAQRGSDEEEEDEAGAQESDSGDEVERFLREGSLDDMDEDED